MRVLLFVTYTILIVGLFPGGVTAGQRIALLIGNQNYERQIGRLTNPYNDIQLVAVALKKIGFEVMPLVRDASRAELLFAVQDFAEKLQAAGSTAIGVLYYSGHGFAADGQNYLIPVTAKSTNSRRLRIEGVRQRQIVEILKTTAPAAAHYVIIDACRNNIGGSRGAKGFVPTRKEAGVFFAFSTKPGDTASDEGRAGGPYAKALASEIVKPGVPDLIMFHKVRVSVIARTNGDQVPWTEDGIQRTEREYFGGKSRSSIKLVSSDTGPAPVPEPSPSANKCGGALVSLTGGRVECVQPGSGRSFKDCAYCPEMVVVPAGSAKIGSSQAEIDRLRKVNKWFKKQADREGPERSVTVENPFAVSKYEITRGQFGKFIKSKRYKYQGGCLVYEQQWVLKPDKSYTDPGFRQKNNHPAVCVNWDDATAYAKWLSAKTGKNYRLLTDAEWEYAARAGTQTRYHFADDQNDICRYANGADETPHPSGAQVWPTRAQCKDGHWYTAPVGSFKPNAWGLYDVHGNAWEWVQDCYATSPFLQAGVQTISAEKKKRCQRTTRGGSWLNEPEGTRSAIRNGAQPIHRRSIIGFRLARMLAP